MDMGIYGDMDTLQFSSKFRRMFVKYLNFRRIFVKYLNFRRISVKYFNFRRIFVKYLNFRRFFVEFSSEILKIRQISVKCHPNVVNLGPWANELEDKWILYT